MPQQHEFIIAALERRLVHRKRLAGVGVSLMLALFAGSLALCSSCQSVPSQTLVKGLGGDEATYDQLVAQARELYGVQPRDETRLRESAAKFGKAAQSKNDDYPMLMDAARAFVWLASFAASQDDRVNFSKEGLKYTSTALKLKPEGPEALYYHAVLSGRLADNDRSYGLDAVGIIERNCKKVIELGVDVDHGGAHRAYGALLIKAPGPPTSIGSLRNGRKQLEQALEKAPDWPENHLYMAELEFKWAKDRDRPEEARKARRRLQQHLLGPDARAPQDVQHEFTQWQQEARKLLAEFG